MNTDSIGNVLRSISRRNPALSTITSDALASLSSDDFTAMDQVVLAKRIALSNGIDIDPSETDPEMLMYALSDAVIRLSERLISSESSFELDYEEATDEEIDDAHRKSQELRKDLTSFQVASTRCNEASGFWDRIPSVLHYIYAAMLIDLCQQWQIDPLTVWDEKARG